MSSSFRLGLIQLQVGVDKTQNLTRAAFKVREAVAGGAQLVSLPECFNSPYGTKYFPDYAETIPTGESCEALRKMAVDNEVFLIGGSIPEKDSNKLYNTATVWSPEGQMIAKHRKMHLFDIDIPGKITFKESENLSPGNSFTVFETPFAKVGLGVCYDIRFADMAQIYARKFNCHLIIYPAAGNMITGPDHYEILVRTRALDNQVYVANPGPARDEGADYVAWGHSTVMDPWGKIVAQAGAEEEIIYADIDLDYLQRVRNQIPITQQRRDDRYEVQDMSEKYA